MGVWGVGLYSDDFAADLRGTISALARLPIDADEILYVLRRDTEYFPKGETDLQYTTFWLVIADQFQRRGIACDEALETAIKIIVEKLDIEKLTGLGVTSSYLQKRGRVLAELHQRLTKTDVSFPKRKTMKNPERFVMSEGDVFRYPVSREECMNPYFTPAALDRYANTWERYGKPWKLDGWGAIVVIGRGLTFDYLAWYSVAKLTHARAEPPVSHDALSGWVLPQQGTCSRLHFERIAFEWIGHVEICQNRLLRFVGTIPDGSSEAVQGITIANELYTTPVYGETHTMGNLEQALSWKTRIDRLDEIAQ